MLQLHNWISALLSEQRQVSKCRSMQIVFAVIAPKQVIANLAAGAIAEAGAQQAGDMMQVSLPVLYSS